MTHRLPDPITRRLRLPLIAAPMLNVSGVDLVVAACRVCTRHNAHRSHLFLHLWTHQETGAPVRNRFARLYRSILRFAAVERDCCAGTRR